ncbi:MAG: hypothetical protein AAF989_06390, partial [Planctomycetota bacterium]
MSRSIICTFTFATALLYTAFCHAQSPGIDVDSLRRQVMSQLPMDVQNEISLHDAMEPTLTPSLRPATV